MKLFAHKLPLVDRLATLIGFRVRESKQASRAFQPAGVGGGPVASAMEHLAGKSGEPAGWKVCPTNPRHRHAAFLELP